MTLLLHSMSEFADIILAALDAAEARHVCEIGAEFGGMSNMVAGFVGGHGGRLTSIDPAPKAEFLDWIETVPHAAHVARPSLEAIPEVADVDAWLVDGDHNWYTVYHELKAIDAACARDGKPLLAFLHDVAWPCGHRDLYYAPAQIPEAFRHAHSYDSGALPGQNALAFQRGFRGMGAFAFACHEGGPRNGVKAAINDFIQEKLAAGVALAYAEIPAVFGLGVLFALDAPWSERVADIVLPYHQNKLIARIDANRIANYLAVIDWQDRTAQAATV